VAHSQAVEPTRRDFLYIATGTFGGVGAALAAWPFITQMNPSASVLALASIEVDISTVQPGQAITVMWRGKPVFIRRRTPKEIQEAASVPLSELLDPLARNANFPPDAEATDANRLTPTVSAAATSAPAAAAPAPQNAAAPAPASESAPAQGTPAPSAAQPAAPAATPAPAAEASATPAVAAATNEKPEWLVVVGVCTHLGCIPLGYQGSYGGWLCPCHGSQYDTAGRVRQGPAPENLAVPPYAFLTDTRIKIG
jgi:ubiquinol-cytochrome c reductase iron-sulfur subunit